MDAGDDHDDTVDHDQDREQGNDLISEEDTEHTNDDIQNAAEKSQTIGQVRFGFGLQCADHADDADDQHDDAEEVDDGCSEVDRVGQQTDTGVDFKENQDNNGQITENFSKHLTPQNNIMISPGRYMGILYYRLGI